MYFRTPTPGSIGESSQLIKRISDCLFQARTVVIGAGAGLSASAGFSYSGKRFEANFADFIEKYGFRDMYSAGFYPYETREEFWAYWSRHIFLNRYDQPAGKPYEDLLALIKDKDYFVLTTNVDHRFQTAGFEKERLFYTQGDYGLWQCSKPCHLSTYDNEKTVRRMVAEQMGMRVPSGLVPYCPVCGAPMSMNLRIDETFVEDEGWHAAAGRYKDFLVKHRDASVLFLELGVGDNTPGIIQYPFMQMVRQNKNAVYARINLLSGWIPGEIANRSLVLQEDIGKALAHIQSEIR